MVEQILEIDPPRSKEPKLDPELELLSQWLDDAFEMPGLKFRFGLDAIIGLIPGLGDTLTSFVSLYILRAAGRLGMPRVTMARMATNIAVDYVLGAVPLVGDAFDIAWKANRKNLNLLRRHIAMTPKEARRAKAGDMAFVAILIVLLVLLLVGSITVAWLILSWIGGLLFSKA